MAGNELVLGPSALQASSPASSTSRTPRRRSAVLDVALARLDADELAAR
jgi:hypothetical protein